MIILLLLFVKYKSVNGVRKLRVKEALFYYQRGICPICRRKLPSRLQDAELDHDHATGDIRGLLHPSCNQLLGAAGDSIRVLDSAIAYLRRTYQLDTTLDDFDYAVKRYPP